jgi:hypothetical protein
MAMGVKEIRSWLMSQPRPTTVRVVALDGQSHTIEMANVSFVNVAETLLALEPDKLEAIGADGKLLRAVRPAEQGPPEPSEQDKALDAFATSDPETTRVIIFARLISDAYRHSTETAFDRMVSLFEAVNRRSEALEKSLELTQRILTKAAADQLTAQVEGGGTSGLLEQMLTSFLTAQGAGRSGLNGAAKPAEEK